MLRSAYGANPKIKKNKKKKSKSKKTKKVNTNRSNEQSLDEEDLEIPENLQPQEDFEKSSQEEEEPDYKKETKDDQMQASTNLERAREGGHWISSAQYENLKGYFQNYKHTIDAVAEDYRKIID